MNISDSGTFVLDGRSMSMWVNFTSKLDASVPTIIHRRRKNLFGNVERDRLLCVNIHTCVHLGAAGRWNLAVVKHSPIDVAKERMQRDFTDTTTADAKSH